MKDDAYTIDRFAAELRRITAGQHDEKALLSALRPVAQRFALSGSWREPRHGEPDPEQGFGVHLLHEEADHTLAVFAASWLPGRGTPPHDHGTWAIVVGVDGPELNRFYARADDRSRPGYAELRETGRKVCGAGDVLAMPAGIIHSVHNESDRVTLSLHVYGKHVNHTQRSQYDPDRRVEKSFIVKLAEAAAR